MTNEEAILWLVSLAEHEGEEMLICAEDAKALQMGIDAIKALEQQTCEDCISREEVLDYIAKLLSGYLYEEERERLEDFTTYIAEMPSVIPQQTRWIPCSERLPEREGWYLTSLGDKTYGDADVDMYCKGWVKYGTHVLAWMPLPQPYTESEDENGK